MSHSALRELAELPSLKNHWVALDFRHRQPTAAPAIALRSGAFIVDCDRELDVLCARLRESRETSLTIVYAGSR